MSKVGWKMKASVALLFAVFTIETAERIKASPDLLVLDSNFYMIATFGSTLIYFFILFMYANLVTNYRRKVAVVAVFLGTIAVILPMRFFLRPPRWDFEFRLIFTLDKEAFIVLMLLTYLRDNTMKILSALFISLVSLFVIHYTDPYRQPYNSIITGSLCTIIFVISCWLYIRVQSDRKWKITIVVFFIFLMFGIILTYILCFQYSHWDALFYIIHTMDMCLVIMYPLYKSSYEWLRYDQGNFLELTELPTRFTFENLLKATKNFQLPIGKGGSGTVYKGKLSDGTNVAVKHIKGRTSGEDEFKTEITILASLQHINLVHLLGYCLTKRGERCLVYPFFENGSLDSWIFSVEEKRCHLTWKVRYQIAVDVAKALSYLHHDCRHHILHLDVKPGNILLDGEFRAKLSDFGVSRAMSREDSTVKTRARGTIGYLSPEMLIPTAVTTKSDVYSYGKVLLELIGGRRNSQLIIDRVTQERYHSYYPKLAREKMLEGRLMEVVDNCLLNEHIKEDEVKVLVNVAFWCIQESPELRPSMVDVIDVLEGNSVKHSLPENLMFGLNFLELESQCTTLEPKCSDTTEMDDEYDLFSDDKISIGTE